MPDTCQAPNCDNSLNGKRKDALYCSNTCKLAAYHARKGVVTKRENDFDFCQREGCTNRIPENRRADSKWCSNACRQRVWHEEHKAETQAKRDKNRLEKIKAKEKQKEKEVVEEFIQELMG